MVFDEEPVEEPLVEEEAPVEEEEIVEELSEEPVEEPIKQPTEELEETIEEVEEPVEEPEEIVEEPVEELEEEPIVEEAEEQEPVEEVAEGLGEDELDVDIAPPIDLADELDIDDIDVEPVATPVEPTEEEIAESTEEAPAQEPIAEEQAVEEETPVEAEPQTAESEDNGEEIARRVDEMTSIEDIFSTLYTATDAEKAEQAAEQPTEAEQPAETPAEPAQRTQRREAPVIGGQPVPEALYDEMPDETEQPAEEVAEEPAAETPAEPEQAAEAPAEKSPEELALEAMMRDAEAEAEQDIARENGFDNRQITLEEVEADSRYQEGYTAFERKMIAATNRQRYYYSQLKNYLLQYKRISHKLSNAGESFRQGGKLVARITLNNDKLRLHLCLEPTAYNPRQYHHYSLAKHNAYKEVPFTIELLDDEAMDNAGKLINIAMASKYLFDRNKKWEEVDYAAYYTIDSEGNCPAKPEDL